MLEYAEDAYKRQPEISEADKSHKSNEPKSTANTKFKQFLLGICGIIFIPVHFFCRGIVSLWKLIVSDIFLKLLSDTIMLFISKYSPFIYRLNDLISTLILGSVKLVTYCCLLPLGVFKWLFDGVISFINLVRTFNQKRVLVSDKRQDVYHKKEAAKPDTFSGGICGYVFGVYTIHTKDELEDRSRLELEDTLISQSQPYKQREYYLKKQRPMCDTNGWFGTSIWF